MKKLTITTLLLICFALSTFSQETISSVSYSDFLKLFPKTYLPICIDYKKDKFEIHDGEQGEIRPKSVNHEIGNPLVKKFLLLDKEKLFYNNEFGDTVECSFYLINQISINKPFNILVYERQYVLHDWRYSEKFLCVLSKQGKLISKKLVASYNQIDFYITSDGGRMPFYGEQRGCIQKDLQINVIIVSDNTGGANEIKASYLIQSDGQIKKKI